MKIIIFGATGTIGKLAVAQTLADGHQVTAFARSPNKLDVDDENLHLVAGDATVQKDVCDAIQGHDAAIITLGSGMSRKSTIRSAGTMNVIRAMQKHNVERLICQSTLGAHETWQNLNWFWKYVMFGFLLKPVFQDHELQEKLVRTSGLDWTIVRPSAFTDEPASDSFLIDFAPSMRKLKLKIARSDVARFLSHQVLDRRFSQRAVSISK